LQTGKTLFESIFRGTTKWATATSSGLFVTCLDSAKRALSGAEVTTVGKACFYGSLSAGGIQKIEAKLNVQTSVLPPSRSIGGLTESDDVVCRCVEDISRSMLRVDPRKTVAATVARCDHCRRGGVAQAKCSGCSEAQFCSKECLVASWQAVQCKTSVGLKRVKSPCA
jgi:hypothetical protein